MAAACMHLCSICASPHLASHQWVFCAETYTTRTAQHMSLLRRRKRRGAFLGDLAMVRNDTRYL
eukprot:scaffold1504_cov111-Isochrysis_galbana.AAC.12